MSEGESEREMDRAAYRIQEAKRDGQTWNDR